MTLLISNTPDTSGYARTYIKKLKNLKKIKKIQTFFGTKDNQVVLV
jgi:hypothetical protein